VPLVCGAWQLGNLRDERRWQRPHPTDTFRRIDAFLVTNHPQPACATPRLTSGWIRLTAGSLAQVSEASTTPNRVRAGPSCGNDIIAQLPLGAVVEVLDGPVCADGLVFWKVESDLILDGVGWTAEGDGLEYYLEPYRP
jgi:hypothetical protein